MSRGVGWGVWLLWAVGCAPVAPVVDPVEPAPGRLVWAQAGQASVVQPVGEVPSVRLAPGAWTLRWEGASPGLEAALYRSPPGGKPEAPGVPGVPYLPLLMGGAVEVPAASSVASSGGEERLVVVVTSGALGAAVKEVGPGDHPFDDRLEDVWQALAEQAPVEQAP